MFYGFVILESVSVLLPTKATQLLLMFVYLRLKVHFQTFFLNFRQNVKK